MKDFVLKVRSFITFDFPLQTATIASAFVNTHHKLQMDTPAWSTTATRQKLISEYWFRHVTAHFISLYGLPALITTFVYIGSGHSDFNFIVILLAGLMSYIVMYLFHYRPCFEGVFLPRLETVKETYERKQTEQLEKCRQAQLSNFALTLIFYVFDKICKNDSLQCTDKYAKLMAKLYGVDAGSLKKNLALIIGKNQHLSVRKSTEMRNQFEEAYAFLSEMNFIEGIAVLESLERRLLVDSPFYS